MIWSSSSSFFAPDSFVLSDAMAIGRVAASAKPFPSFTSQKSHAPGRSCAVRVYGGRRLSFRLSGDAELRVQHCNDVFSASAGALASIACLPNLRMLELEDLHLRIECDALAEIANVAKVLTSDAHVASSTQGCANRNWA